MGTEVSKWRIASMKLKPKRWEIKGIIVEKTEVSRSLMVCFFGFFFGMQLWIARTGEESCQLPCFQRQIADQLSCKQYERTISPRCLMLLQDLSHSQVQPNLSTTWDMAHCRWLSRLSLTTSSERTGCSIVCMHIPVESCVVAGTSEWKPVEKHSQHVTFSSCISVKSFHGHPKATGYAGWNWSY